SFFSSRRRHTRFSRDWSSDVCSSDLLLQKFSIIEYFFSLGFIESKKFHESVIVQGGLLLYFKTLSGIGDIPHGHNAILSHFSISSIHRFSDFHLIGLPMLLQVLDKSCQAGFLLKLIL